jgi:hypothetical protein
MASRHDLSPRSFSPGIATSLFHSLVKCAGGDHHNAVVLPDQLSVNAVITTDIDPLQSIRRPDAAPASIVVAIVVIVGVAEANECEATEAVVEEAVVEGEAREVRPERGTRKGRIRETRAGKARAADKA